MISILTAVRPGYLVLGAAVAAGLYAVHGADRPTPSAALDAQNVVATTPRFVVPPQVAGDDVAGDDERSGDADQDESLIGDDETMRGLSPIEDPAEFAMVFSINGTSYVRLSTELRASSHGRAELVYAGEQASVVAPVSTRDLPPQLRAWAGRTVLVDGTCAAHVVGFAEVSRVAGDPPGTEEYYYEARDDDQDGDKEDHEKPAWTIETVVDNNVTLAAKLDGCHGSWARASEYPAAKIAEATTAPELEAAALADLLAKTATPELDEDWKRTGGEGEWQDAVAQETQVFVHPDTGEQWVFARIQREGSCGDFGVSAMSAYHVTDDGKLHHVADLDYAGVPIHDVVDLDGDGQPEIVFGDGDSSTLVDLTSESRDAIDVEHFSYGCGC